MEHRKVDRSPLYGKHEGTTVDCTPSQRYGFRETDGNWFKRSDGTHQYMVGNVHYCDPVTDHAIDDLRKNREYLNKVQFPLALHPACPMPVKPFFDASGFLQLCIVNK